MVAAGPHVTELRTVSDVRKLLRLIGNLPAAVFWSWPGSLVDAHVAQGFAWNEETVAFGVSDTDENCLVDVDVADHIELSHTAISALAVPFTAKSTKVDIGSVGYANTFTLPVGTYTLVCETLPAAVVDHENYDFLFRIRFVPNPHPEFKILKQGGEVHSHEVLSRTAKRA